MERTYKQLVVWKEADDLCVFTYEVTKQFPPSERFGLISQMRRSAMSVPTNIVEGNTRRTIPDKAHFFTMSLASAEELHYQFHLSLRLQYIPAKTFDEANDRIQRVSFLLLRLRTNLA